MAELNRNYNKIMSELEEKIKDPSELEFVKSKISELTVMFMDTIERLVENSEKQVKIEKKVNNIQKSLKRIEQDIYIEHEEDEEECDCDECEHEFCKGDKMHDNDMDYEFEIVCPYCNHEFVTGKEANLKDEIECPNCHNIIELDWDDYCDGECNNCDSHCYSEEVAEDELKIKEDENTNYKYSNKNKEDKEKNKKEQNKNNDDKNSDQNNENEDDM